MQRLNKIDLNIYQNSSSDECYPIPTSSGSSPSSGGSFKSKQDNLLCQLQGGSFTEKERLTILLTASAALDNQFCCELFGCCAASTGLTRDEIIRLNYNGILADRELNALREFTSEFVAKCGRITQEQIDQFVASGYRVEQLFELVSGVAILKHLFDSLNQETQAF